VVGVGQGSSNPLGAGMALKSLSLARPSESHAVTYLITGGPRRGYDRSDGSSSRCSRPHRAARRPRRAELQGSAQCAQVWARNSPRWLHKVLARGYFCSLSATGKQTCRCIPWLILEASPPMIRCPRVAFLAPSPNDRATGSYACRARSGGSRVAGDCGKRRGGERLGGRRRLAVDIRRENY
jgi:hypothetical protein